ncbi:acyl-CoA dehydrogenase family protein [Alicyclobacillus sendaiensis]|uniref:acyl-CoA dehydrogenase family protein n=1 Tax=Alicyclobacillus sendaiensis TaxID=192387 RepID=UPI000782D87E|nr:acyl-CoA dehydrogenase family protein [Alicyclobacillus sendaiensis]
MLSFLPSDEERAFVEVAQQFARERLRESAREAEKARTPGDDLVSAAHELGLLSLEIPESLAGAELPLISQVQVLEALAHGDLGIVQGLPGLCDSASVMRVLPQPERLELADGAAQRVPWIHLSPNEVAVIVERSGFRLEGVAFPRRSVLGADQLLVSFLAPGGEAIVAWLDRTSAQWSEDAGDVRLGLLAAHIGRLGFEGTVVRPEDVLLRGDEAEHVIREAQARVAVLEAAKCVGAMRASLEYTIEYTSQRKAFGQEIPKFQGVSFTVADMAIETEAARNLVWQAAHAVDQQGSGALQAAARALAYALRSGRFVTNQGVQMLGGAGYLQEYPVEKWMRDVQAQAVLYGRELDWYERAGARALGLEEKEGVLV